MKDCRECAHGQTFLRQNRMCIVMPFPRTIEYQRDPQSLCGVEARLFTQVSEQKHSEFDDD